uniref:Uncharacterized protein n=1 Tax=Rhizophora mucronata TaxID=61149 RepID=A0A2P2Q9M2_RHIMU
MLALGHVVIQMLNASCPLGSDAGSPWCAARRVCPSYWHVSIVCCWNSLTGENYS